MSEKIEVNASDIIELRNFQMWVKRELRIFKNQPNLQNKVVQNIDKVTTLPLEEIAKAFFNQ